MGRIPSPFSMTNIASDALIIVTRGLYASHRSLSAATTRGGLRTQHHTHPDSVEAWAARPVKLPDESSQDPRLVSFTSSV